MSKKFRAITLSCITVMVCMALLVVGTYALFSDEVSISNHLQAGNLEVNLVRTAHSNTLLNNQGVLATTTVDNENVDFTGKNNENLFAMDSNTKIAPGCAFSADLKLENNGDVAFNWSWELVLSEDMQSDAELLSQLKVTVTVAGEDTIFTGAELFGKVDGGFIAKGGRQTFTIKVEFENLEGSANNAAQDQNVYFDLIIYAIQATA